MEQFQKLYFQGCEEVIYGGSVSCYNDRRDPEITSSIKIYLVSTLFHCRVPRFVHYYASPFLHRSIKMFHNGGGGGCSYAPCNITAIIHKIGGRVGKF